MYDLPPAPNLFFGRYDELHRLREKISNIHILPRVIAITGPAGIGKSALAITFLEAASGGYNPVWVPAFDIEEPMDVFEGVLDRVSASKKESLVVVDTISTLS